MAISEKLFGFSWCFHLPVFSKTEIQLCKKNELYMKSGSPIPAEMTTRCGDDNKTRR